MAQEKTLEDLFGETLRDVLHAERQLLRTLPRMAKAARSDELRKAFENHAEETETQIERLEQVFEILGKPVRAKTCDAMIGLIEEAKEAMTEFKNSPPLDAALTAAAQTAEHYEIARYGTLKAWAGQLGLEKAKEILEETLREEEKTDELLTRIATRSANREAAA